MSESKRTVTIIPARITTAENKIKRQLRVAAYCRVSTEEEEQLSSYEAQCNYYTEKIMSNPEWTMAGIYADEGITGTSTKKREEFKRMIFDLDSECGKMFREPFPAETRKGRTSGSSSKNSSELVSIPFMSLDLTPGAGNLLDEFYWEILSPWRGEFLILNTGPAPRSGAAGSTLWSILEARPHPRYFLTRKACQGILRRAYEREKPLPEQLKAALEIQAGVTTQGTKNEMPLAFAANQRDEVWNLHDVAGALGSQPGMKQQTFVAAGVVTKGNGDCFLSEEAHTKKL